MYLYLLSTTASKCVLPLNTYGCVPNWISRAMRVKIKKRIPKILNFLKGMFLIDINNGSHLALLSH